MKGIHFMSADEQERLWRGKLKWHEEQSKLPPSEQWKIMERMRAVRKAMRDIKIITGGANP